ncbi:MAG: ankyrin repeat domain-containing protein [Chthonomonadales bacterium]
MKPDHKRTRRYYKYIGGAAAIALVCLLVALRPVFVQGAKNASLIRAIKSGDTNLAIELLNQGSDANSSEQSERFVLTQYFEQIFGKSHKPQPTALMLVFSPKNTLANINHEPVELVRALLARGANVNAISNVDTWSREPIVFHAASEGCAQCVQLLLDHGVDPNTRNETGATPLIFAGNTRTARLLINRGADVNARTDDGYTALRMPEESEGEQPEAKDRVRLLIAAGAKH